MNLKFMTAVHARLAGNEDVDVPDLNSERELWEEWLMSDPPKEALRTNDENVLYAALFPETVRGLSTEDVKRQTFLDGMKGHVTEVGESG